MMAKLCFASAVISYMLYVMFVVPEWRTFASPPVHEPPRTCMGANVPSRYRHARTRLPVDWIDIVCLGSVLKGISAFGRKTKLLLPYHKTWYIPPPVFWTSLSPVYTDHYSRRTTICRRIRRLYSRQCGQGFRGVSHAFQTRVESPETPKIQSATTTRRR